MPKPKTTPAKLLIVCRDNDERAKEALKLAAATLTVGSGLRYTWRNESACLIGRVELDAPSSHPVFLIGPCGLDFSPFEGHNACTLSAGILVATRRVVEELELERPKNQLYAGILERPVAGMKRAIVITASHAYDGDRRRRELEKSVADAICGAVKIGNKPHRSFFLRKLRVAPPQSNSVARPSEQIEAAAAVA